MRHLPIAFTALVTFMSIVGNCACGQTQATLDPPFFRPRTDTMATRDADAVRERLKASSDSRGPINPLADYVKPKKTNPSQTASSDRDEQMDEEARRIPRLDADAQQRLKAQPPSIAASERHVIGLYPPPQIATDSGLVVASSWQDDGFRPISARTTTSSVPTSGVVIRANYQIGDPAAMIPPSLGIPSSPPGAPPAMGAPPIGAPATITPPSGPLGVIPGNVPMVGAPGTNVIPAPPSYIVPSPSGTFTPPGVPSPYTGSAPYAAPTPTYSRSGGTVNSLPFVSPPPQARDARWMVSPEVYRRMEGGGCNTPSAQVYGAPQAGAGTGSPFFYAPPVAMPMPTPRTASRHSWLHPFRH